MKEPGPHDYAPQHGKAAITRFRDTLRENARNNEEPARLFMNNGLRQLSVNEAHLLPKTLLGILFILLS